MPKARKPRPGILLAGDTSDPLVNELADLIEASGIPSETLHWCENRSIPAELSESGSLCKCNSILIHRRGIGPTQMADLATFRTSFNELALHRPNVELILGDLARYAEVQVLEQVVDRITPEAVAIDLLPGRLMRLRGGRPEFSQNQKNATVGVISTNKDLASVMVDLVESFGLQAISADGWSDPRLHSGSLMIWDVPLLSDRWTNQLQSQARRRPVLALMAMAQRHTTARARAAGAVACLDLPFETEDLRDLLVRHVPAPEFTHRPPSTQPQPAASVRMRSGQTILRPERGHAAIPDPGHVSARPRPNETARNSSVHQAFRSIQDQDTFSE